MKKDASVFREPSYRSSHISSTVVIEIELHVAHTVSHAELTLGQLLYFEVVGLDATAYRTAFVCVPMYVSG